MSPEMLAYPFLFLALFFESFILVTLLSQPARDARLRTAAHHGDGNTLPSVAVIVPCLNEGETVAATTQSLLALAYPKDRLRVILVDNGSTDATPMVMERFRTNPQVRILNVPERGKHIAVNAGIAVTDAEFIGCLDADSFVEPDALSEIIPCFAQKNVAAVTAAMSVYRPKNLLQHMQNAEYTFGITMRHTLASVNGLYVTPGPFSFYRRSAIKKVGGFRRGHQTEDMEMALRLQQAGYAIENAPRARVYTTSPDTVFKLVKQRVRWTTGFLRNVLGDYRCLIGARERGALGMLVLPFAIIAIGSGIALFSLMLYELIQHATTAIEVRVGIPLSYALVPRGSFDWFYFPTSLYLILGILMLFSALFLIAIGKNISKTPGNLAFCFISYTFLYGLIAPLWLIRAITDFAFGRQRDWKS